MLLSAAEVGAALGAPVCGTALPVPCGTAVSYRGEGLTVLVTLTSGAASRASLGAARRFGRPLSGTATEGWLLNRGRTVVLAAGDLTAKISIGGRPGGTAGRSFPHWQKQRGGDWPSMSTGLTCPSDRDRLPWP